MKTRFAQASLAVMFVAAVGFGLVGCGDDLYGQCSINADTMEQCTDDDGSADASCVVDQHVGCQTGSCGRYKGSEAFCTVECDSDGDCPSGECRSFLMTSDQSHCVAETDLEGDG